MSLFLWMRMECNIACIVYNTCRKQRKNLMRKLKFAIFAEFAKIPGAYSVTIDFSADEYPAFKDKAQAAGKPINEFAKDRLMK